MTAPAPTFLDEAAALLAERLATPRPPSLALVTGSGLGALSELGREIGAVEFGEIPGLGAGTVAGHAGRWVLLERAGRFVYCLCGRRHLYEGIEPAQAGHAMAILARLGVGRVVLTNAAGGLSPRLAVGDLMLIRDHLNLMFCNPLRGVRPSPGHPLSHVPPPPYDPAVQEALRGAALAAGLPLKEGIYAGLCGPNYETRAEVAMLRRLGADAVGMSTVPEALTAARAGLGVVAVSFITNSHVAAEAPPTHAEVLATARLAGQRLLTLLGHFMDQIPLS